MAGCRVPPADPAGGEHPGDRRGLVLTGQLAADSAVTLVSRPAGSGKALVYKTLDGARAAGQGFLDKRLLMHLWGPPDDAHACGSIGPAPLACGDWGPPGCDLQPAQARLYIDGGEALAALEQVIASATCRIDVLMYMWDQTPLGTEVARRLASRAGPDLRVRVLVDGGGNLTFGEPDEASAAEVNRAVLWLAAQPHVEVIRTRNPFGHFDHRKLVVADGRLAWTGGRNLTGNGFSQRHDLSFTVAGPLAAEMDGLFEQFWRRQGGRTGEALPAVPPAEPVNGWGHLVVTEPTAHQLEHELYAAVDQASHFLYLENPYVSDSVLIYKLGRARRRGADVRVVLSVETDTPSTNAATRVIANRLLRAGVRVYLYPGPLHTKAATADGCWLYVGTGNFDPLSLRCNHELGVIFRAGTVIADAEELLFQADFQAARELTEPLPVSLCDYLYEFLASAVL